MGWFRRCLLHTCEHSIGTYCSVSLFILPQDISWSVSLCPAYNARSPDVAGVLCVCVNLDCCSIFVSIALMMGRGGKVNSRSSNTSTWDTFESFGFFCLVNQRCCTVEG